MFYMLEFMIIMNFVMSDTVILYTCSFLYVQTHGHMYKPGTIN